MGCVVGVAYGVCDVRSPAPPVVALLGLLGMVIGEQAVTAVRPQWFAPTATQASSGEPDDKSPK